MSSRYSDQPGSMSSRSMASSGGSYTERYRVDNDFPSDYDLATRFAAEMTGNGNIYGSESGSVSLGERSSHSSRAKLPAPKLLENLIGMLLFFCCVVSLEMT